MSDLNLLQLIVVALIFVWSGFVRNALGFGGAALSLPLFLFIIDDILVVLPIIAIHLVIAVLANLLKYYHQVDWRYMGRSLIVIMPFKIAGIIGLLNLPPSILSSMIYFITIFYSLSYITQIKPKINSKLLDNVMLAIGGYVSGTSLVGAPLIIAVYSKYIQPGSLRATLFLLWLILVTIKLGSFVAYGVDLQLKWAVYALPFAWFGQWMGDKAQTKLIQMDKSRFMYWIGWVLLLICLLGLSHLLWFTG